MTGLCYIDELVCAVHQGGPGRPLGFVVFDPGADFAVTSEGAFDVDPPIGPHSVRSRHGELYFAFSGRDSVYKGSQDSGRGEWTVSPYWTLPGSSGKYDENHVNAIECIDGELHVSGFGKKGASTWGSARNGFVYNIDRDALVMDGLDHPHSLLQKPEALWTCESRRSRVVSSNGDSLALSSGSYARGLAMNEDFAYVGVSKRRRGSKSQGGVGALEYEGVCCIYRVSRVDQRVEMLVDFSDERNEIYDLLLL